MWKPFFPLHLHMIFPVNCIHTKTSWCIMYWLKFQSLILFLSQTVEDPGAMLHWRESKWDSWEKNSLQNPTSLLDAHQHICIWCHFLLLGNVIYLCCPLIGVHQWEACLPFLQEDFFPIIYQLISLNFYSSIFTITNGSAVLQEAMNQRELLRDSALIIKQTSHWNMLPPTSRNTTISPLVTPTHIWAREKVKQNHL